MNESGIIAWQVGQLVRFGLFSDEQAVLRSALRALFQSQPQIRQRMITRAYTAGEISLGKAAEIMGVSSEEMKDILVESSAEIHLGPRRVDELHQDIAIYFQYNGSVPFRICEPLRTLYRNISFTTLEVSDELYRGVKAGYSYLDTALQQIRTINPNGWLVVLTNRAFDFDDVLHILNELLRFGFRIDKKILKTALEWANED